MDQETNQFRDTRDLEGPVPEACFPKTSRRELHSKLEDLLRIPRSQEAILTEVRGETETRIRSATARFRQREEKVMTRASARSISQC